MSRGGKPWAKAGARPASNRAAIIRMAMQDAEIVLWRGGGVFMEFRRGLRG
jgi:hypothetical protein